MTAPVDPTQRLPDLDRDDADCTGALLEVRDVTVPETLASDHRPVVANLVLSKGKDGKHKGPHGPKHPGGGHH